MQPNPQFNTKIKLSEQARRAVCGRLNIHLANTLDLHSQVKQAHWTIKGPQFFARHQLFDEVAAHLRQQADEVAERISTLGGYPRGTVRMTAHSSLIATFDTGHVSGAHLLRDIAMRLAAHAGEIRDLLPHTEADDPVTADLLMGQLRAVELDLWFFESHFNE